MCHPPGASTGNEIKAINFLLFGLERESFRYNLPGTKKKRSPTCFLCVSSSGQTFHGFGAIFGIHHKSYRRLFIAELSSTQIQFALMNSPTWMARPWIQPMKWSCAVNVWPAFGLEAIIPTIEWTEFCLLMKMIAHNFYYFGVECTYVLLHVVIIHRRDQI